MMDVNGNVTETHKLEFVEGEPKSKLHHPQHIHTLSLPPRHGTDNRETRRLRVHLVREPASGLYRVDVIIHGQFHHIYLPRHLQSGVTEKHFRGPTHNPNGTNDEEICVMVQINDHQVSVKLSASDDPEYHKELRYTHPVVKMSPAVAKREKAIGEGSKPTSQVWPHHGNTC